MNMAVPKSAREVKLAWAAGAENIDKPPQMNACLRANKGLPQI